MAFFKVREIKRIVELVHKLFIVKCVVPYFHK